MKPLDIRCGVCGAGAGLSCMTTKGGMRSELHVVRVAAAKRGNRPPHSR